MIFRNTSLFNCQYARNTQITEKIRENKKGTFDRN